MTFSLAAHPEARLELFAAQETKADMIVTFLALLELIRLKRV